MTAFVSWKQLRAPLYYLVLDSGLAYMSLMPADRFGIQLRLTAGKLFM